jgi:hypothetical protein
VSVGSRLGFELGSIAVLGLELGIELGFWLGGKITVVPVIFWSSSKVRANAPDWIDSSFVATASETSKPVLTGAVKVVRTITH